MGLELEACTEDKNLDLGLEYDDDKVHSGWKEQHEGGWEQHERSLY